MSKHFKVVPRFFNSLLSIWISDETLFFVLDTLPPPRPGTLHPMKNPLLITVKTYWVIQLMVLNTLWSTATWWVVIFPLDKLANAPFPFNDTAVKQGQGNNYALNAKKFPCTFCIEKAHCIFILWFSFLIFVHCEYTGNKLLGKDVNEWMVSALVVSFAAVFRDVTQRSPERGCKGDYSIGEAMRILEWVENPTMSCTSLE